LMRSMNAKYSGLKFSSVGSGPRAGQIINLGIDSSVSTAAVTDSTEAGKVDLQAHNAMQGFNEKLTSPRVSNLTLTAGSVDTNLTATSLPAKELQGVVRFFIEHIKAKELSEAGKAKFAELVHRALPAFGSLGETVTLNDLVVSTEKGKFGAKMLDYSLKMDGLTKSSNVNFGLRAEHLTEDAGIVPAAYASFLPESLDIQVGIPDINFEDLIDTGLKVVSEGDTPMSRETLTRSVFPSGYGTVEFPRISATSGVYDVEASGELKGSLQNHKSYSLQATILARNFDATVAAVQEAAKTNPRLNSVSFSLMAAKGFAKTDPDGRLRWDVAMDENHTVTVNGQIIKKP
ncbi:MAG: hypothetical protein KGI75_05400, partial [Rhizobiaceae bacterium]|nr:hypothetical protein [Rhizobiaceae bacterium]